MDGRARLPNPGVQTAVWSLLAAVATIAVLVTWPLGRDTPAVGTILALGVTSLAASMFEVEAQLRDRGRDVQAVVSLSEAALVLLLLTVPPGWAWLLTVVGITMSRIARRRPLLRILFNHASWSVSLAAAVAVHALLRPGTDELTLGAVVGVVAAVTVHLGINHLAVETVVAASTHRRWGSGVSGSFLLTLDTWLGNLAFGFAAAALWLVQPWLLPLVGVIAALLHQAYRQFVVAEESSDRLRLERDRLDTIVRATTDGLALLDHDAHIVVWNAAMVELTGIPADEVVGRPFEEVLDDITEDRQPATKASHRARSDTAAEVAAAELTLRHRDGERRIVVMIRTRQTDRLGALAAQVVQFRDTTTAHELEQLKDDVLSRLSHELRTPLTSIIGYASTLDRHGDRLQPAARSQMRRAIVERGNELTRLMDDLLLVSLADGAAEPVAHPARYDLGALVESAATATSRAHGGRPVEVILHARPVVEVDASWVSTIVSQLVSNALQYSDPGTLVQVQLDERDGEAVLRVSDEGRGIPASMLADIFDRFTRIEAPLRMETRGVGLGLFIVRRLVTRLGGHISVESRLGQGSVFEARLPATTSTTDTVPG